MAARKVLVVCYSRTGTTRLVADAIAGKLGCSVEELVDTRKRLGIIGAVRSAFDAFFKRPTVLEPIRHTPADVDLMLVGTPVWGGTLPPAIRTYLSTCGSQLREVAFFCTERATGAGRVFEEMAKIGGRAPVAVLAVHADEVPKSAYLHGVDEFVDDMARHRPAA